MLQKLSDLNVKLDKSVIIIEGFNIFSLFIEEVEKDQ